MRDQLSSLGGQMAKGPCPCPWLQTPFHLGSPSKATDQLPAFLVEQGHDQPLSSESGRLGQAVSPASLTGAG